MVSTLLLGACRGAEGSLDASTVAATSSSISTRCCALAWSSRRCCQLYSRRMVFGQWIVCLLADMFDGKGATRALSPNSRSSVSQQSHTECDVSTRDCRWLASVSLLTESSISKHRSWQPDADGSRRWTDTTKNGLMGCEPRGDNSSISTIQIEGVKRWPTLDRDLYRQITRHWSLSDPEIKHVTSANGGRVVATGSSQNAAPAQETNATACMRGTVKTPLTRRYLTEVEARLRQTESRLKDAEQRATLAENRLQASQSFAEPNGITTSNLQDSSGTVPQMPSGEIFATDFASPFVGDRHVRGTRR
ncbi:hypothetical protein L1887_59120 [Cichorium endivia]|nr:hypothetical protein L1887_59120 [Cichorium endivia]